MTDSEINLNLELGGSIRRLRLQNQTQRERRERLGSREIRIKFGVVDTDGIRVEACIFQSGRKTQVGGGLGAGIKRQSTLVSHLLVTEASFASSQKLRALSK